MRRVNLLRLNLRSPLLRPMHQQLLHGQRHRAVLFTRKIRRGNLHIRLSRRGGNTRRPRVRTKRLRPLLAVRRIVQEQIEGGAGKDSAIRFLSRISHSFIQYYTKSPTEIEIEIIHKMGSMAHLHRAHTTAAESPQKPRRDSRHRAAETPR